jgi:muramoyltetrapeptide carboxypeptidase LdcA involved in peptidoglycan recycling
MVAGTPLMPPLAGHVVMVEEVSEYLYAVDRLFFHACAHLGGWRGCVLAGSAMFLKNDRPFGAGPEEIARHWCAVHAIPFLGGADIGHDAGNKIVPLAHPRIDPKSMRGHLTVGRHFRLCVRTQRIGGVPWHRTLSTIQQRHPHPA